MIALGLTNSQIKIWNFSAWQIQSVLVGHTNILSCFTIFKGSLVSAARDKTIRLWSIEEEGETGVISEVPDYINCLAALDKHIISGHNKGQICIWKAKTLSLHMTLTLHKQSVTKLVILND